MHDNISFYKVVTKELNSNKKKCKGNTDTKLLWRNLGKLQFTWQKLKQQKKKNRKKPGMVVCTSIISAVAREQKAGVWKQVWD